MTKPLTRQTAEAHEALYPALARLAAQLEAMAARRPTAPVPPAARSIAADLLFEAQAFGWHRPSRTRRDLPEPAADVGGLATQLGQALALLDAFEAAHSAWYPDRQCFAWQLLDPLPVRRLRPETSAIVKSAKQQRESDHMRSELIRLMEAKVASSYDQGYADASSGREHRAGEP